MSDAIVGLSLLAGLCTCTAVLVVVSGWFGVSVAVAGLVYTAVYSQ